ncbi:MAG TPA: hypothetical protein VFQ62_20390 [Methylomirabilota bacterium]|nr:hypothetical protein [Methylomirabilota bacterium]
MRLQNGPALAVEQVTVVDVFVGFDHATTAASTLPATEGGDRVFSLDDNADERRCHRHATAVMTAS